MCLHAATRFVGVILNCFRCWLPAVACFSFEATYAVLVAKRSRPISSVSFVCVFGACCLDLWVFQEEELKRLLEARAHPICYDGFEPSGRMHIAQGVMRVINVNKLTK